MDLSGSYSKLTPAVSNLPCLKSFSCLASFGIEGESIPNEMSSLAFETEEQVSIFFILCSKRDTQSMLPATHQYMGAQC